VELPRSGNALAAGDTVAVRVVDERPADKGGQDKTQVGQVRGSGIPSSVNDADSNVATRTVTEAAFKQALA
jgi:hypothetical protein